MPFLLAFLLKFKLEHEETLRLLNTYIHTYARMLIFGLSIILAIFSFTNIFYEYFVRLRSEGGMWSIEISIFMSLATYILYSKTLML